MLYVRPSSRFFKYLVCVHRGRVCPGSVGTRLALLQGWLLCVGFVSLANVPDLVRWLSGSVHLIGQLLCNQCAICAINVQFILAGKKLLHPLRHSV